jgi:hypothetical protein
MISARLFPQAMGHPARVASGARVVRALARIARELPAGAGAAARNHRKPAPRPRQLPGRRGLLHDLL